MSDAPGAGTPAVAPAPTEDTAGEGRRVTRNSLLLGVGEAVGLALGFATTLLVTDRTGYDYGLLIGAQRWVALFMVLVQFGLHPLLVRAIASSRGEAGSLVGTVLLTRIVIGLVLVPVVPAAAWLTGYLPEARWLLVAWLLVECLGVVAETYMAVCEGLERMAGSALISVARSFATFFAVIGVTWIGGGLPEYVMAYVTARSIQVAVAVYVGHRTAPGLRLRWQARRVPTLIRQARWYAAMGFASAVQGAIPVLALSRLAGQTETALFGAALNFLEVVMVLPLLIQRALLPAFSRLAAVGGGREVGHYGLQLVPMALVPASLGLALLASPIVALYPSGEFDAAAPALATIALWLVVIGPGNVSGTYLTGHGRMRALVLTNAVGIALQAGAQLVLVPAHGAVGAAAATLVSYAFVSVTTTVLMAGDGVRMPYAGWGRTLLATAMMGAVVWPLRGFVLPVPVIAGVLAYAAASFLLAPRDGVERRLLRGLMASRRAEADGAGD